MRKKRCEQCGLPTGSGPYYHTGGPISGCHQALMAELERQSLIVANLTGLVRQLATGARTPLREQALDYLRKENLGQSLLR